MQKRYLTVAASGFVPARLTIARQSRSMRQNELAKLVNVTPATISKWESDSYGQGPDQQAVLALAGQLDVGAGWFYKPVPETTTVAFFRSLRSELGVARDKAAARLRFVYDIGLALSEDIEFPDSDIPDLLDGRDYKTLRSEDIERVAVALRDYWMLGDDPIEDLTLIVENAGVLIGEDYVQSSRLDGVSRWFGDTPVILLAKDKEGAVRRRFDLAHELGHLVLHRVVSQPELESNLTLIEEQAMAFAGCFLLPAASFSNDVNDTTLDHLADLKPKWRVSIGAMIKRLGALGLVSEAHERNLWKYYSYRKWRGNEPYDDRMIVERPVNLKTGVEMIINDGRASTLALLERISLSSSDVADLTGAEKSSIDFLDDQRPRLSLVKREPSSDWKPAND